MRNSIGASCLQGRLYTLLVYMPCLALLRKHALLRSLLLRHILALAGCRHCEGHSQCDKKRMVPHASMSCDIGTNILALEHVAVSDCRSPYHLQMAAASPSRLACGCMQHLLGSQPGLKQGSGTKKRIQDENCCLVVCCASCAQWPGHLSW